MTIHRNLFWISAIFLIGFLIRFSLISRGPYHSDCLYLSMQSEKILKTHQMQYLQSSGLPLTAVLGAVFIWLFKVFSILDPVFAVNFMSVWFGSLCIVAIFYCVKQLTDARTGLISSVLLALNPFFIGLSIFGNSHMLATFFLLTGIYYLLRYPVSRKTIHLFFCGFWLGCMGAARLQDFAVMIFPIIFLMLSQIAVHKSLGISVRKYLTVPWASCFPVLVVAYLPKFLFKALPTAELSFYEYLRINLIDHLQGLTLTVLFNIMSDMLNLFSPGEWIFILGGFIYILNQKKWHLSIFLLFWIFTPVFVFCLLKFFVYRFLIISFVPIIILESICASNLFGKAKVFIRSSIFILLMSVLINLNIYYPMFLFRHQHALLPDFFQWINTVTEENAEIIERDHSIWISHYSHRRPFGPKKGLYHLNQDDLKEFKIELDYRLNGNVPVYITKYGLLDQKDLFRKFMLTNYRLEYIGSRLIEDWHLDCLKQVVVQNDLFRIRLKSQ